MKVSKKIFSLVTALALLALAAGCESPEYEEEDRLGTVPETTRLQQ